MNNLGVIYKLSRVPHVKQLILCEIIARASKKYLFILVHDILLKSREATKMATLRGRSGKDEFYEHQINTQADVATTIVDFFNAILGSQDGSTISRQLWTDVLPEIIFSKFSLEILCFGQKSIQHLPMLFNALQYHTSVVFRQTSDYMFGFVTNPLTHENLVDYLVSNKACSPIFYGALNVSDDALESFIANEMFSDAVNIFRLRLSAILLMNLSCHTPKVTAARNELIYNIILCKYLDEDYEGAKKAITSALGSDTRVSIADARLYTLAMCIDFQLGNFTSAMNYYDIAKSIYLYAVGSENPVLSFLNCALGDLYFRNRNLSHAKVMYLLAYEHSTKFLGASHILVAEYALKLGAVLAMQDNYADALDFYLDAYQTLSSHSDSFLPDIKDCLVGLSLCYFRRCNFIESEKYCTLFLDVVSTEKGELGMEEVRYLTLMADIKTRLNKIAETLSFLGQAWSIIALNDDKPQASAILMNIAKRSFKSLLSTLTMRQELLLNSFRDEFAEFKTTSVFEDDIITNARNSLWENGPKPFFREVVTAVEDFMAKRYKIREGTGDDVIDYKILGSKVEIMYRIAEAL
jgi:tetratricopeptide (TPR) repeat protein